MKANVMRKAWELAREGQKKFGGKVKEYFAEALRLAWAFIKKSMEKVQLKGTEKQIKWAENIREDVLEIYNIAKEHFLKCLKEKMETNAKYRENREKEFALYESKILNNDNAKFFIDNFGFYSKKETNRSYYLSRLANDLIVISTSIAKENNVPHLFGQSIGRFYYLATKTKDN